MTLNSKFHAYRIYLCIIFRCNEVAKCGVCSSHNHCSAQYPYITWRVSSYGNVSGEDNMIKALQDGPIVCGLQNTPGFQQLTDFQVYKDDDDGTAQQLSVSIVGYGVDADTDNDDGTKYWIGRVSWGDYWAYHGFFRIIRGINNLGIEQQCYWALPSNQTCEVRNVNDTKSNVCHTQINTENNGKYAESATKLDQNGLPTAFRWNSVNGTNFLTPNRNQNVPNYCGSDWAFAVTSMMSDGLNIERIITNKTSSWPEIMLSVQSLLNQPSMTMTSTSAKIYNYVMYMIFDTAIFCIFLLQFVF